MTDPASVGRGGADPALRLILDGPLHPARNMAVDEALLLAGQRATLRFYGWSPPGLSLGYFQRCREVPHVDHHHALVRRPTGGGAIYHDDEITFALAVDAELLPGDVVASYALVHGAIADALRNNGVAITAAKRAAAPQARPSQPWCFADPGPSDLLAPSGGKLVGSAQRRIRRPRPRVLHHGSIVLDTPAATPFCGTVAESQPDLEHRALIHEIAAALARALGLATRRDVISTDETRLVRQLEAEKYGDPSYTRRR